MASAIAMLGRSARSQAEGVNSAGQFVGEQVGDHPVAVQTRAALECRRNNFNAKMGLSFRAGPGVTLMARGFVDDFQVRWR